MKSRTGTNISYLMASMSTGDASKHRCSIKLLVYKTFLAVFLKLLKDTYELQDINLCKDLFWSLFSYIFLSNSPTTSSLYYHCPKYLVLMNYQLVVTQSLLQAKKTPHKPGLEYIEGKIRYTEFPFSSEIYVLKMAK